MNEKLKKFHIISIVTNPMRFQSRYRLFEKFQRHIEQSGIPKENFHVTEMAFGDRPFEIHGHGTHHRFKSDQELWHKENLINLAIARLPSDWEYVAWIDADIEFVRPDWVNEAVERLCHHPVIQLWQNAIDLGPHHQTLETHTSFGFCHSKGLPTSPVWKKEYTFPHPGYAWAIRREVVERLGGMLGGPLIDFAILGSGDHHMAYGFLGRIRETVPHNMHPNYLKHLLDWEESAVKAIRKDIGFLSGTILHYWHGKKKDRKYVDRWQILQKNQYDPEKDIRKDSQGMYRLVDHGSDRSTGLRDGIRNYFRSRNEDSIDLD